MEQIKSLEQRIIERAENELRTRIESAVNQVRHLAGGKVEESVGGVTLDQHLEIVTSRLFTMLQPGHIERALDEALNNLTNTGMWNGQATMPSAPQFVPPPAGPRRGQ